MVYCERGGWVRYVTQFMTQIRIKLHCVSKQYSYHVSQSYSHTKLRGKRKYRSEKVKLLERCL